MTSPAHLDELVRSAERLYETRWQSELELTHPDEFVAVEPVSGEYFLGVTLSEAVGAARDAYPERLSHVLRIGHQTALHFGVRLQ
jgi:hypothetical protein